MSRFFRLVFVVSTLVASPALAAPPAPPPARVGAPLDLPAITKRAEKLLPVARAARATPAPSVHWTLTRRPDAPGDLTLPLGGSRFDVLEQSSSGLHLRRRATGADFWYSGVLVTDASGKETRIPAEVQGDQLIAVVPAQLLASVRYPAELDPDLGPAIDVAPANAQAVASDGTDYLLAWSSGGNIWAARVNAQGTLLDPTGIFVAKGSAQRGQLSVAYASGVYLVSWVERTPKTYQVNPEYTVTGIASHFYFARVTPQGQVLDPSGKLITDDEYCLDLFCEYSHVGVVAAGDGTNFLVAGNNNNYTLAAQITPGGVVSSLVQTPARPTSELTQTYTGLRNLSIAFDGSSYATVAVQIDSALIETERLAPDGTAVAPGWTTLYDLGLLLFAFTDSYPQTAIAFGGDSFLALWTAGQQDSPSYPYPTAVYASRISRTGTMLDAGGILLASHLPAGPSIGTVFDGCNFVTTWNDQAVRIRTDGTLLDSVPSALPGPVNALATDGIGSVLAVSDTQAWIIRTCGAAATNPVFDPPPSPVAEATGPQGATVTFQVTAHNESGPAIVTCTPASGSLFPLGTTSVSCTAADPNDHALTSSAAFDVLVRDTTPPTVLAPPNVVAPATGPNGAAVPFTVAATDLVDPSPVVTCSRPSGSVFPVGVTTVSCSATDSSRNVSATVTFTVSIQGAGQQIAELIALINSFHLRSPISSSLVLILQAAGSNAGSCTSACTLMSAFSTATTFARLTGMVSPAQGAQLTTAAKRIRSALGCGRMCGI